MITEQQARDAIATAQRHDAELDGCEYGDGARTRRMRDACYETIAEWAAQELARRDAERIERAKPIDAAWCVANGAMDIGGVPVWRFATYRIMLLPSGLVTCYRSMTEIWMGCYRTRGQLLDLLAALKGGA